MATEDVSTESREEVLLKRYREDPDSLDNDEKIELFVFYYLSSTDEEKAYLDRLIGMVPGKEASHAAD